MTADSVTPIVSPENGDKPAKRGAEKSPSETLRFRMPEDGGIVVDLLLVAIKYQFFAIEKIIDTEQDATTASYLALAGQQLMATLLERQIT